MSKYKKLKFWSPIDLMPKYKCQCSLAHTCEYVVGCKNISKLNILLYLETLTLVFQTSKVPKKMFTGLGSFALVGFWNPTKQTMRREVLDLDLGWTWVVFLPPLFHHFSSSTYFFLSSSHFPPLLLMETRTCRMLCAPLYDRDI